MARKARIIVDDGEAYVYTPYIESLVYDLRELPVRRWDSERRCWIVPEIFVDDVIDILSGYKDVLSGVQVSGTTRSSKHRPPDFNWVDELFAELPSQALTRVYRSLAYAFHPDVGGNPEIMKQINLAYERRRRDENSN